KHTTYAELRKRGIQVIKDFHARQRWQDRNVLGTEIPFLVPFGEHELHGFVDLLETKKSGNGTELLRVVDYKSGAVKPWLPELFLDIQFTVYMYAVKQKVFWVGTGTDEYPGLENGEWLWETIGSQMPTRAIWYHLMTHSELDAGPRTQTDFDRL